MCLQATSRSSREIVRDVIKKISTWRWITTHCSNRFWKVQTGRIPTSSQTETCRRRMFPLRGDVVPAAFHWQRSGIHDTSFQSTMKCDADMHKDLYVNRRNFSSLARLKHDDKGVNVGSVDSFALSAESRSWLRESVYKHFSQLHQRLRVVSSRATKQSCI